MPGGLNRVVEDAFTLIGSGKVVDRGTEARDTREWMRPIFAEKLIYRIEQSAKQSVYDNLSLEISITY
jgi:hypothetical protein